MITGWDSVRAKLQEWVLSDGDGPVERLNLIFLAMTLAIAAPIGVLSAYLWWFGGKVLRAAEFPPPGARVVRDTAVLRGDDAERRGRTLRRLGVACSIAAVAAFALLWRAVRGLAGSPA